MRAINYAWAISGGDEHFVHCSEVVPSSEVEMYGQLMAGASSLSIVERLSSYNYRGVHHRRFYCSGFHAAKWHLDVHTYSEPNV